MLIVTVEVILVALLGDPDMMETVAVGYIVSITYVFSRRSLSLSQ